MRKYKATIYIETIYELKKHDLSVSYRGVTGVA